MIEAVRELERMDWSAPEQDLAIPHDRMPPWPRDGLCIAVARAGAEDGRRADRASVAAPH